jgi:ABC-type nitrate/sulfonate/bicarbonate transport system substrate-binding protein
MITRRNWLKQMGLAAGCSLIRPSLWAQSPPTTPASIQLGWVWGAEFAGYLMGEEKGYYSAQGLNMEIRPGGPQVDEMVMLMARKVNITVSDVVTSGQAMQHGAKIKIIGSVFQQAPFCIMSLPGNPIRTPKDLIGKKIGSASKQDWAVKFLCLANNIDPQSLTILPASYDPAPLVNHQVDGFVSFATNEPLQLADQGIPTVSMIVSHFGLSDFSDCLVVREDALNDPQQRALLAKILRGTIQGWQEATTNPEEAAKALVDHYGEQFSLKESVQLQIMQAEIPFICTPESLKNGLLSMSEASIAANVDTLSRVGLPIKRSLFDTSLIQEVMGGKSRV